MISYEIAMGMAAGPVFMLVGDLNLQGHCYQADGAWLVFKQPIAFVISGFSLCRNQPTAL